MLRKVTRDRHRFVTYSVLGCHSTSIWPLCVRDGGGLASHTSHFPDLYCLFVVAKRSLPIRNICQTPVIKKKKRIFGVHR